MDVYLWDTVNYVTPSVTMLSKMNFHFHFSGSCSINVQSRPNIDLSMILRECEICLKSASVHLLTSFKFELFVLILLLVL